MESMKGSSDERKWQREFGRSRWPSIERNGSTGSEMSVAVGEAQRDIVNVQWLRAECIYNVPLAR